MKNEAFVIERIYNAPVEKVWQAITDKSQMKEWYFELSDFKPEIGFEFTFPGNGNCGTYVHLCKVTEVIPNKKLSYTWKYQGFEGNSEVSFELFEEEGKTRLKLTHEGIESFPHDNPDFGAGSFSEGWTALIGTSLKEYVE